MYQVKYSPEKAPKVGVVSNSIKAFNEKGKQLVEAQFRDMFQHFKEQGIISQDSIYYPQRIFGPHEVHEIAKLFGKEQVDVIIILNSAFPNGHVLSTIGTYPYLIKIPIILTADYEPDLKIPEWTTNAWCGVIMNNYAARQMGRYVYPLAGSPLSTEYQNQLKKLLSVFYTVSQMRKDFLGRFGDAPGGFHSATGEQLIYAEKFGTRVETMDLSAVMNTYRTGVANGYVKQVSFTDKDIKESMKKISEGRIVLVEEQLLEKGVRLYHTFKAQIEANGFTSAAFRCWPEFNEEYIGVSTCMAIGWLLSERVVTAASCESDWPMAVVQSIGTYLSGKPAACLDFVNFIGGSDIIQLGHCGVGIPGLMANNDPSLMKKVANSGGRVPEELKRKILAGEIKVNEAIAEHSAIRQAGQKIGPVYIGQFQYGPKTGINLIRDRNGNFKMLVFRGESSPQTTKNMLYSAADIRMERYRELSDLIIKHGFSHHLAVAMDDICEELKILCDYYGIEYISPHN